MIGAHLTFVVPGTPIPKGRPRVVHRPGQPTVTITPKRTKQYEAHAKAYAWQGRQRARGRWPLDARYRVEIRIYRADAVGDCDNIAKSLLDACNGILWTDDSQVDDLHVIRVREPDGAGDRLVVEVAPC